MVTRIVCQIVALLSLVFPIPAKCSELAVGPKSKVNEQTPIDVFVQPPASFNYLTKKQVLDMRQGEVDKHVELVVDRYQPSFLVFGQIEDEKPWWGIKGSFIHGSGEKSIEGDAEESRFLVNPFLLVGLNPNSAEIWDESKLSNGETDKPDFPYFWKPSIVRFWPRREIVQIAYEVSDFNKRIKQLENLLKDKTEIDQFSLVAYNARDFGYEYIYVPVNESVNIANQNDPRTPVRIQQYIHCGGSSGFPGGCNNMSPEQPQIDRFKLKQLPAKVKVLLWKTSPGSITTKPDLTVLIDLR